GAGLEDVVVELERQRPLEDQVELLLLGVAVAGAAAAPPPRRRPAAPPRRPPRARAPRGPTPPDRHPGKPPTAQAALQPRRPCRWPSLLLGGWVLIVLIGVRVGLGPLLVLLVGASVLARLERRVGLGPAGARVVVRLEALEELVARLLVDRDLVADPHPVGPL